MVTGIAHIGAGILSGFRRCAAARTAFTPVHQRFESGSGFRSAQKKRDPRGFRPIMSRLIIATAVAEGQGRMIDVPGTAQQTEFFTGERKEENAALRLWLFRRPLFGKQPRQLDDPGSAGRRYRRRQDGWRPSDPERANARRPSRDGRNGAPMMMYSDVVPGRKPATLWTVLVS